MTEETQSLKLPTNTAGGVFKALVLLAVPIILANLLESVTEIVDLHFIGTLGEVNVAGASAASSLTALCLTLILGIGIAITAFVAQAHGEGNKEKISTILSHIMVLGLIICAIIAVFGTIFCDQIMLIVTRGNEVTAAIGATYLHPMMLGMVLLMLLMFASAAFQGIGKPVIPMIALLGVNIVNAILNPILIGVFGLPGSAYATLIARGMGAAALLILMFVLPSAKASGLGLKFPFKWSGKLFGTICSVAIPSSIQGCIRNFGLLIMTSIVAVFGTAALAAYGICTRTDIIGLMIGLGLAEAVCILVGQNIGAGNIKGAKRTVKYAVVMNAVIMGIIAVFFITAAPAILTFFGATGESLSIGLIWMSMVPLASILMGIAFMFGFAMNGAGLTWPGMVGALTGQVIVPVGIALLAAVNGMPITIVFIGVCAGIIANFIIDFCFYMSGIWVRHGIKQKT